MLKSIKVLSAFLLAVSLLLPISALAAENTDENTAEEELLIGSDKELESLSELAKEREKDYETVYRLNAMIDEVLGKPDAEITISELYAVRDVYVTLPDAMRIHVEGYDGIRAQAERLKIVLNDEMHQKDPDRTDEGKKLDKSYAFRVNNDRMSLSVRYAFDSDGDGIADRPEISLVSPSGNRVTVEYLTTAVEKSEIRMQMTWEDAFMQMDIDRAENGVWRLETSEVALIELFEYSDRSDTPFDPVSDPSSETVEEPTKAQVDDTAKTDLVKSFIPLILLVILAPILFIVVSKINRKTKDGGNRKRKKDPASKFRRNEPDDDDDWDTPSERDREKEREEMEAMEKYLRSQKVRSEFDEEAARAEDVSIRKEIERQAEEDDEEPGLIEYTEYPSGMLKKDDDDDDDGFGKRV